MAMVRVRVKVSVSVRVSVRVRVRVRLTLTRTLTLTVVVALEDVSAVLEPVARQAQDLSAACVITIYGDPIQSRDTEASCVRCTVRPAQAPAHERVARAERRGPAGRPALRLSYGHGTHGSASCYVKHRDKRTWVLVQERLKVVPLTAYSPVARGWRVKRHTRRPNGLELLVLCCCSRSRSRHQRRVTSSALAHRRLRTTQSKVVAKSFRSAGESREGETTGRFAFTVIRVQVHPR